MLSDNVQYWLQGSIEVLLKTGKKIVLNKGVYTDKELNSLIGMELRVQMIDSCEDVLRTNKLEKVTKLTISLKELDNSDNLEDGKPSNTLFTYYVAGPEYSTHFEPHTPQYKKFNTILDGVRAYPILDGGGGQKSPPRLTLPFSV